MIPVLATTVLRTAASTTADVVRISISLGLATVVVVAVARRRAVCRGSRAHLARGGLVIDGLAAVEGGGSVTARGVSSLGGRHPLWCEKTKAESWIRELQIPRTGYGQLSQIAYRADRVITLLLPQLVLILVP